MAIIVEEERPGIKITSVLMWLTVLAVVASIVYYIFFAQPQIVDIAVPAEFQNINNLSAIDLNPEEVIGSSAFQSLKQYVTPPQPGNTGRINPFVPPQ